MQLMIRRRKTKNALLELKISELKETMVPFKESNEYQENPQNYKHTFRKYDGEIKQKKLKYQRDLKDFNDKNVYKW